MSSAHPLLLLPPEIRERIYTYCKTSDLVNVSRCCKSSADDDEDLRTVIWHSVQIPLKCMERESEYIHQRSKHLCYTNKLTLCGYSAFPVHPTTNKVKSFLRILKNCNLSNIVELLVQYFVIPEGAELGEILALFTGLEHLSVNNVTTWQIPEWSRICNLTRLTRLVLDNCNIHNENLTNIGQLTHLRQLSITRCFNILHLCAEFLDTLEQLQCLRLSHNLFNMQGTSMHRLTNLQHLQLVRVVFTDAFFEDAVDDVLALESLAITSASFTDQGLLHVSQYESVTDLNVSHCASLTNNGLKHVSRMQGLRRLNINACKQISDEGVLHVSCMRSLELFNCSACTRITDVSLEYLCRCVRLKVVNVKGCPFVTVAGVEQIKAATIDIVVHNSCTGRDS